MHTVQFVLQFVLYSSGSIKVEVAAQIRQQDLDKDGTDIAKVTEELENNLKTIPDDIPTSQGSVDGKEMQETLNTVVGT